MTSTFTLTGTLFHQDNVTPVAKSGIKVKADPYPDTTIKRYYTTGITFSTNANGHFSQSLVTEPGLVYTIKSTARHPEFHPIRFDAPAAGATVDITSFAAYVPGDPPLLQQIQSIANAATAAVASVAISTWQASTSYVSGQVVQAPDGSRIKSNGSRTSRASFDATEQANWTVVFASTGTLEQAAFTAAATNAARAVPAIDILGDSITAQNGGTVPSGAQPSGATYPAATSPQARGYLTHAITLLGHRARAGTNFGIGGQTSAQILTRVADVVASPNPIVVVYAGINDAGNGISSTVSKQNLLSIYQQLRTAGKTVVAATVTPSLSISGSAVTNAAGLTAGVTSFTAAASASPGDVLLLGVGTANVETVTVSTVTGSGPFTINLTGATTKTHARGDLFRNTTRLGYLHDLNQWIIDYCRGRYTDPNTSAIVNGGTSGIYMVDWHSIVADPNTGQPVGSLDGLGAVIGVGTNPLVYTVDGTHPGQDVAHRMGYALAVVLDRLLPPLPIRNGDNSDATNLLTNGRAVGNTSGLATGYTLTASSGTVTATPTKVTRTDGIPGEAQQVAIGPGNTGQAQLLVGDIQPLVFNGTDSYVGEIEFETDANLVIQTSPAGGSIPLGATIIFRLGGTVLAQGYSHFAASGTDGAGSVVDESGVFRTEKVTPPATATRVQLYVWCQGVDTLTFRVKSARVRKVTA